MTDSQDDGFPYAHPHDVVLGTSRQCVAMDVELAEETRSAHPRDVVLGRQCVAMDVERAEETRSALKRKRSHSPQCRRHNAATKDAPRTTPLVDLADNPDWLLQHETLNRELLHAFREPLFPINPSPTLAIAYSHRQKAEDERTRIRNTKRKALHDLKLLREEFGSKKRDLLEINATLKASSRNVISWTQKVFDLELNEQGCKWNDKLKKLRDYVAQHGNLPERQLKVKGTEEEKELVRFIMNARIKVKNGHKSFVKFPHRYRALEELGVTWERIDEARFEVMFTRLLAYRKEHGTFRLPSLEICKESGDKELIELHHWTFTQVNSFRYQLNTKNVEVVKRFLDVGFSFERWYATNGHVFDRDIPPYDDICRRYVNNGGRIDNADAEILRVAAEISLTNGKKKRGKKNAHNPC